MRETADRSTTWRPGADDAFRASTEITGHVTRADLHAHTRASAGSAAKWLGALGVAESYSEPEEVYDLARRRGMDLVAITDHDTIDGALALHARGFDQLIIGEEITTRFTDTRCVIHVLVWGMTPERHDEIDAFGLREDAAALAHWLRDRRLAHALAHPLFDINRRLTITELRRCLSLFGGFEAINAGHTTARHRLAFERFVRRLSPSHESDRAAHLWPNTWFTGGSDDHALHNLGRAWTALPGSLEPDAFLEALMRGESVPGGADGTTDSLAMQFIGVARRYATEPHPTHASRRARRVHAALTAYLPDLGDASASTARDGVNAILQAATNATATFNARIRTHSTGVQFRGRDILRAVAPILLPQAAHVAAFMQHQRERRLLEAIEGSSGRDPSAGLRVALFVDALDHTSGVSRFVLDLAREAARQSRELRIFTCADRQEEWPESVRVFRPIGRVRVPFYEGLELAVPWAPDCLDACADWAPHVVHVSTPGPMGVVGAIAAQALGVPRVATHHTDFPAYAARLTGSARAEQRTAGALSAFYERFDRVLARSEASAAQVRALRVPADRLRVLTPGIDLTRVNAARRDDAIWARFPGVQRSSVKALYVGRVSREKNLDLLNEVWCEAHARLEQIGVVAEWIIVGDGPYRGDLARALSGRRARLLGRREGDELAAIYASSDFFLFPSTTDTLGQVVIEAQASGLPAIVTDQGGPPSLIVPEQTGVALPADDADAWVRAIVLLAADGDRRRRMSRAAAAHARQFSFERSFQSFWSIHEELATPDGGEGSASTWPAIVTDAGRSALNHPPATASP